MHSTLLRILDETKCFGTWSQSVLEQHKMILVSALRHKLNQKFEFGKIGYIRIAHVEALSYEGHIVFDLEFVSDKSPSESLTVKSITERLVKMKPSEILSQKEWLNMRDEMLHWIASKYKSESPWKKKENPKEIV